MSKNRERPVGHSKWCVRQSALKKSHQTLVVKSADQRAERLIPGSNKNSTGSPCYFYLLCMNHACISFAALKRLFQSNLV
jgi:hypothetical protein